MQRIIETETGKYIVRPYQDADHSDVLTLWEEVFGKSMPDTLWRWKYLQNPFGHQILLGFDEAEELVAMYGGIPYSSKYGEENVRFTQLMDIMTHPRVRKSGLFVKAAHSFIEYVQENTAAPLFLYGFPGQYHLEIGEKYLGYRGLSRQVAYLKFDLHRLAQELDKDESHISSIDKTEISMVDDLWEKCKKYYPLSVIRNAEFFNWRFLQHPLRNYEIFGYFFEPKVLDGYMVYLAEERKVRIIDLLVPDEPDIIEKFVLQMGSYLLKKGIDTVETWLPAPHFITNTLANFGFESLPEPIGFTATIRPFESISPSSEWISENLYYTMADADLF